MNNDPQQEYTTPAQQAPKTVAGIIALVFGILGCTLSFIPIVNNLAAIFGLVGAVFGLVAIVATLRGTRRGKVMAIVATVLSVLSIVVTLAMQSAASDAFDEAMGVDTSQTSSDSSKKSETKTASKGEQDMEGDLKGMHVKIVSAVRSGNDYDGNATVLVTYEWTNNTDKNNSFASLADPKVFQNGSALDDAIYMDSPEGYDANSYLNEVQPGATATATIGYVLKDDSAVSVDVSALFDMSSDAKVTHVFNL